MKKIGYAVYDFRNIYNEYIDPLCFESEALARKYAKKQEEIRNDHMIECYEIDENGNTKTIWQEKHEYEQN